jgi:uncharacterized zinc-type alcohol dehydrogenase-like protein
MKRGTKIPTYGVLPTSITADEEYTLHISDKLELSGVVSCYVLESPPTPRRLNVGRKGHKVGVLGLGGLGHMAVKFAASFAEVTMLSHSPSKEADAKN